MDSSNNLTNILLIVLAVVVIYFVIQRIDRNRHRNDVADTTEGVVEGLTGRRRY